VPSLNHAAGKLAFPGGSHDPVSQKIKSLLNMHNPRLLRIQPHTQPLQYPSRSCQRRPRFSRRLTRNHPIVGEPRQLISFASHLLIKRRQKNVTEQWRSHAPYTKGNLGLLAVSPRFGADPSEWGCCDEW